ncbi:hypothetical protein PWT90_08901 [Aphanocladium album]|nr:hypothetical protein PWT90_08901 [Aphanocladium album]
MVATTGKQDVSFEVEDHSIPFSLGEKDAWADYKKHRPEYPESVFEMLFDYHKKHGGKFDAVHDIGAGGGILSEKLSRFFTHVYVSDPGESNLALAQSVLRPASRFSFRRARGEDAWLPPASVDLVVSGESLHWMDLAPTLAAAAASLRPGGTFAAIFYGMILVFPRDARLTDLLREVQFACWRRFFHDSPGMRHPAVRAAPPRVVRGFNSIALPEEGEGRPFTDWTRVNVNLHGRGDVEAFQFIPESDGEFPVGVSRVKDSETLLQIEDPAWGREVDVAWVQGFLISLTLGYDERCWALPEFVEFARIINEEHGGKIKAEFPACYLMGSKK